MAVKKLPEQAQAFQLDSKLASRLGRKGGRANSRKKELLSADQCRAKADQFLAKAQVATKLEKRVELMAMAERWARLAADLDYLESVRRL